MTEWTITLSPTDEFYSVPVNGVLVPSRIWNGRTAGGIPIEAYVISIVPDGDFGSEFEAEAMPHLKKSRDAFKVDHQPSYELAANYLTRAAETLAEIRKDDPAAQEIIRNAMDAIRAGLEKIQQPYRP